VQRYPNNFDYRFRLLFVSVRLGHWKQARQISRAMITDIEQGKPYYTRQWLPLLRYRLAETYVLQGNHDAARPLLRSLQSQDLDETLHAWITLRLGNMHDLQGDHQTARAFYKRVAGDTRAQQLAEQYLDTPFNPSQIEVKPLDKII